MYCPARSLPPSSSSPTSGERGGDVSSSFHIRPDTPTEGPEPGVRHARSIRPEFWLRCQALGRDTLPLGGPKRPWEKLSAPICPRNKALVQTHTTGRHRHSTPIRQQPEAGVTQLASPWAHVCPREALLSGSCLPQALAGPVSDCLSGSLVHLSSCQSVLLAISWTSGTPLRSPAKGDSSQVLAVPRDSHRFPSSCQKPILQMTKLRVGGYYSVSARAETQLEQLNDEGPTTRVFEPRWPLSDHAIHVLGQSSVPGQR